MKHLLFLATLAAVSSWCSGKASGALSFSSYMPICTKLVGANSITNVLNYRSCVFKMTQASTLYTADELDQFISVLKEKVLIEDSSALQDIMSSLASKGWKPNRAKELFISVSQTNGARPPKSKAELLVNTILFASYDWWDRKMDKNSLAVLDVLDIVHIVIEDKKNIEYIDRYHEWAFDKSKVCHTYLAMAMVSTLKSISEKAGKKWPIKLEDEGDIYDILCDRHYGWSLTAYAMYNIYDPLYTMKLLGLKIWLKHSAEIKDWSKEHNVEIFKALGDNHWNADESVTKVLEAAKQNFVKVPGFKELEQSNSPDVDLFRSQIIVSMASYATPEWWAKAVSADQLHVFDVFAVLPKVLANTKYIKYIDHYRSWATEKTHVCDTETAMALFKYFYKYLRDAGNYQHFRSIKYDDRDEIYGIVCDPQYGWTQKRVDQLLTVSYLAFVPVRSFKLQLRLARDVPYLDDVAAYNLFLHLVSIKWDDDLIARFLTAFNKDLKSAVEAKKSTPYASTLLRSTSLFAPPDWWTAALEPQSMAAFNIFQVVDTVVTNDGCYFNYINLYRAWHTAKVKENKDMVCTTHLATKAFKFAMKLSTTYGKNSMTDADKKSLFDIICDKTHSWDAEGLDDLMTKEAAFSLDKEHMYALLKVINEAMPDLKTNTNIKGWKTKDIADRIAQVNVADDKEIKEGLKAIQDMGNLNIKPDTFGKITGEVCTHKYTIGSGEKQFQKEHVDKVLSVFMGALTQQREREKFSKLSDEEKATTVAKITKFLKFQDDGTLETQYSELKVEMDQICKTLNEKP